MEECNAIESGLFIALGLGVPIFLVLLGFAAIAWALNKG